MKKTTKLLGVKNWIISLLFISNFSFSQTNLPKGLSEEELLLINSPGYKPAMRLSSGSITPPSSPVRNMAQWEELQALTVTWMSYQSVLRNIVKVAQQEALVIINCDPGNTSGYDDSTTIKNYLTAGGVPLSNIRFNATPANSIWIRDYMANSCYENEVGNLLLVDWIYNRPRPDDDALPNSIAQLLSIPLYETTSFPSNIIATGGNYMTDGIHRAFSSKLIVNENPTKTETQINQIMNDFMGITSYVFMNTLPYDVIHHIDMHMKLINEETLLVGQYPPGTSDGPQIEANLQFILSDFNTAFGTPYKIIRIPMPPDQNNGFKYPNNVGNYLTYTNATIVNKSVLVPQFYTQYDTTAVRIWKEAMPGYNVVGINSNTTIAASGSIHCITHSVGVENPLLIVHQKLPATTNATVPYQVNAKIQHNSGIQSAMLYYKTSIAGSYTNVSMTLTNAVANTWTGEIPAQPAGTHIYYYIKGIANSGKQQVRPMPAPAGYFDFIVIGTTGINNNSMYNFAMKPAYPNPSHGITCIPLSFDRNTSGTIKLIDMLGKVVHEIYSGDFYEGEKNYFINTIDINAGAYTILIQTPEKRISQKLMIK